MANILYGVSGEGSGHSSRARLIGGWLMEQGHTVKMASYDKGLRNLRDDFDVIEIVGLSISSVDNEVSMLKTITENLAKIPDGTKAINRLRQEIKTFQPDVVITDFEPCTAYFAAHYALPLISVDNQHRMRYLDYSVPEALKKEAFITENIIRAMVPKPWVSLITSFHSAETRNNHSFLFPPILRNEVLSLSPNLGDHILVYATSGFESLLHILKKFPREKFRIYGMQETETCSHFLFRPFSKEGFLEDLASAKAVIATAGFTLITESLHLGKPYLALPMQGQFEQQLNGHMLSTMGYGSQSQQASEKDVAAFLYQLPDFYKRLAEYPRNGNEEILKKLDSLLANNLENLKTYAR